MSNARHVSVLRQWLILSGASLFTFSSGIILALPAVLNPAILSPNATIKATPEQASWIAACHGIAGLLGYCIMSPIFEFFGRKTTNIVMNLFIFCGCFMYYVASDVYSLVFARLAQGLSIGGNFTYAIALSECVSPKRRCYFLVITKLMIGLGSLACHALAFVLDWRHIATFNALPSGIAIIIFFVCPESPSYYASRGEFDKCEKTFKWYRGDSLSAKRELKEFVSAQMENLEEKRKLKKISTFKEKMKVLMSKEFRKAFFIMTLATLCLDACGRYFLLAYITLIMEEITSNTSLAMNISVAFDCILIIALGVSCIMVKHIKRRTLVFSSGFSSVFLMFLVSFIIVLEKNFSLQSPEWTLPTVILLHTFITNIGLVPIAFALTGEVLSLDQRGVGSFVSGIVFITFYSLIMKLTPTMIAETGVEGTYFICGLCLFVSLVLLRLILPETKDKTLQQIEDEIKGKVRDNSDTELLQFTKVCQN